MAGEQTVPEDVQDFLEQVDEISILVEGLKAGTISPEYVDGKLARKQAAAHSAVSTSNASKALPSSAHTRLCKVSDPDTIKRKEEEAVVQQEAEERRKEDVQRKVQELMASRDRKIKARAKYEEYVKTEDRSRYGTDYTKWTMWCPEDEEDDLFNSCTPSNPQFKALEKDIDERHRKMVEQRQIAERQRVAGNAAFKDGQYSEALRCYQLGIDAQKISMTLHGNAAMAALKLNCFVQAIEHCDKALHIAEFFQNNKHDPVCVKVLQRRATAFKALDQLDRAVQDLTAALELEPGNKEVAMQLQQAQQELEEYRKQKRVKKAMDKAIAAGAASAEVGPGTLVPASEGGLNIEKLREVEQLVVLLQPRYAAGSSSSTSSTPAGDTSANDQHKGSSMAKAPRCSGAGPMLPERKTASSSAACSSKSAADARSQSVASTSGRKAELAQAAEKLRLLLKDDDSGCVYLRSCSGLLALSKQLMSPEAPGLQQGPLLGALHEACMNDGNLKQLPSLKVLPACVHALGSADAKAAAAAAALLCTAATEQAVRQEISKVLGDEQHLVKLMRLLSTADAVTQAISLALLGNCMVDKATKSGMQRLWSSSTSCAGSNEPSCSGRVDVGACFESLLASTSEPVAEKAAVLLGNMCGDASLRAAIQAQDSIMLSLLLLTAHGRMIQKAGTGAGKGAAKATPIGTELRSAASTALFNAAMDAAGQQALAKHASAIGALLSVCDPSSSASTSGASVSSDALSSSSQVAEPAVPTATLRARAAGIISRIAKCPEGSNKLAELGAIPIMLAAAAAAVDIMEAHAQTASSSDAPAKPATSDASGLLDAAVRTITVLTASDNLTLAQQVVDANGLTMLLRVIRMQMPAVQMDGGQSIGWEAILGNAALCIGGVVRFKQFHAALREMDAVAALVKVAYDGKGNTASKNAAIALARMAHDTAMLERLRELHGIEIIYQYVKP